MRLSLFDTHCDTALEMYRRNEDLQQNSCHISLSNAANYEKYAQLFAVWSARGLEDEASWENFHKVTDNLDELIQKQNGNIVRVSSADQLSQNVESTARVAILAVEDARLLAGDINRLRVLYDKGVRCMTLLWGGPTCIGGSHDTSLGLTDFGKQVARGCFELGIIPDISHASEQSADDILEIAGEYQKPIIATHSNSYSVYAHSRNLRDRHLEQLIKLGGLVGVSMCTIHLRDCSQKNANVEDIVRHIDRYMELGAQDHLCFGCDFDGTDLPDGITHVGDLSAVADSLSAHGYSDKLIHKIFWENAYTFFLNQLK